MNMNKNRNWLIDKAEGEDGCLVSVGGLVDALERAEQRPSNVIPFKHAFVRFVQLARRERELTLDQFAGKAGVDLVELLMIEKDEQYTPATRTVHRIAAFLKIPEKRLMALAGLLPVKDAQFQTAALRFSANSEPVEKLSREEHAALEEYVKFLCGR